MSFDEGHDRYVQPRNRQGFLKVVCMGSPDGKEIWLALLLGAAKGAFWVEAIHFEIGVRPAGQVLRLISDEGGSDKVTVERLHDFLSGPFPGLLLD